MIGHYLDWLNMGWPNMQALAATPNAPTYTTSFWEWFDRWFELDETERQDILNWHRQFTVVCQDPAFVAWMKQGVVDDGWNRPQPKHTRHAIMHARYTGHGMPSTPKRDEQ